MQLVAGFTLTAFPRSRTVGARCAVALPREVVDGLGAAHAAGLVHRDVKPAKVLVDDADLGDFGLTRAGTASAMTATSSGHQEQLEEACVRPSNRRDRRVEGALCRWRLYLRADRP